MGRPMLAEAARMLPTAIMSGYADRIAAYQGELYPLHVGDTHLAPPVIGETVDLANPAFYRYGKIAGSEDLLSELASRFCLNRDLGHITDGDHIQLSAGATHGICSAARATLNPGDDVLLLSPYWPLSRGMITACGANAIEVPLSQELFRDPGADVRAILERHLTERTKALYIIQPNNPDGKVYSRAQLAALAEVAVERNLWVIADEVYQEYVYEGAHVPVASLPGMQERTLTAYSFSKSYGMAGLRIGFLTGPPNAIVAVRALHFHTIYNIPILVQHLALAALENGGPWIENALSIYRSARDEVGKMLAEAGLETPVPQGSSYYFVDFSEVLGPRPLTELVLCAIDRGVLMTPGVAFGAAYRKHARICFTGAPPEKVREGVARLCELACEFRRSR